MIWGTIPLQMKISTDDTDGALFVFEHADMGKGGPPRHFHHEQDDGFYVIKGNFAFEVGDKQFTLRPGDSLLAPRMVPDVLGVLSQRTRDTALAVQPAGSMEASSEQSCEITGYPRRRKRIKCLPPTG